MTTAILINPKTRTVGEIELSPMGWGAIRTAIGAEILEPVHFGPDVVLYVDEEGHFKTPVDDDGFEDPDAKYFMLGSSNLFAGPALLVVENVDEDGSSHYRSTQDWHLSITRHSVSFLTHAQAYEQACAIDVRNQKTAERLGGMVIHVASLADLVGAP